MANNNDLTFTEGETWDFPLQCNDYTGSKYPVSSAFMRIADRRMAINIMDITTSNGIFINPNDASLVKVFANPSIPNGIYYYQFWVTGTDGANSLQSYGQLEISKKLPSPLP